MSAYYSHVAVTTQNLASWVAILAVGAMMLMSGVQAQTQTLYVSLHLSDGSLPYRKFADAFNSALAASKADVRVVEVPFNRAQMRDAYSQCPAQAMPI